jgi:hypothetical protein
MTFEIKRGQPVAVSFSILSKLKKNYDRREFCRLRKIFVSSGKGGKGSTHLHRENLLKKVDRMVVMEVVDIFL